MKLVAYYRVSTKVQADANTMENQKEIVIRYCKAYKHTILAEFSDVQSAFNERPQFNLLMQILRDNPTKFEGVIVAKLSRLGRSVKGLIEIVEELKTLKIQFICVNDNVDTSTPQGIFFFHIMASFNEYERSLIKERMAEGLERAKREGTRLGRKPIEFNDKQSKDMIQKYNVGIGCDSLGKMYNCSKSTIRKHLIKKGVQLRE